MTQRCDICGDPIERGQPRYGCPGDGGRSGAKLGEARHYLCQKARYGLQATAAPLTEPVISRPARGPVKTPLVKRGEINRSANAGREFKLFGFISEMGRRRAQCDCPFCNARFTVYVWSLSGGGKKCPNCGAMFGSMGVAYPIEGNEEL